MSALRICLGGVLVLFGLVLPMASQAQSISSLIELEENEQGGRVVRFVWGTEPGVRYQLQQSSDLEIWTPLAGDPIEADDLALERLFEITGTAPQFLRVMAFDEQPPVLRARFPEEGDFGVPRSGTIRAVLEDVSAIDSASIRVQVGDQEPFTVADAQVTFDGSEVRVSLGESVLIGDYGEAVTLVLEAADVLGNAGSWAWSFDLEREPQVADGLFVFGSDEAQHSGQRLNPVATAVARHMGVAPLLTKSSHGDAWSLESVEEDRIQIRYSGQTLPAFAVGQLLANLSPSHVREIFYRRVTGIEEGGDGLLILFTEEVELAEVLEDSSFQVETDGVLLEVDEDGYLVPVASQRGHQVDSQQKLLIGLEQRLPGISRDFSGMSWSLGQGATVTLDEAWFSLSPRLVSTMETRLARVERFHVRVEADLAATLLPRLSGTGTVEREGSRELAKVKHWIWMKVGVVPVGVEINKTLTGRATLALTASGEVRTGFRQEGQFGVSGSYSRGGNPSVNWDRWFDLPPPQRLPFTYTVSGAASASVSLIPRVDIRVYGMAGIQLNVDPRVEVSGSATWTSGNVVSAEWNLGARADLNAGLSVVKMEDDDLPTLPPVPLYSRTWWSGQTATPQPEPIVIRRQPNAREVRDGDGFQLSVEAVGPGVLTYQWYRNEVALPGRTGPDLAVAGAQPIHVGKYFVRVRSGARSLDSREVQVTVVDPGALAPCQYTDTYPYPEGNPSDADPWLFYYRECTSYVAWKINERAGTLTAPFHFMNRMRDGHFSDAWKWAANAAAIGFEVNETPAVGAIAHWGVGEALSSFGHVAWVEAVNGDGSVRVSEYNVGSGMNGRQPHRFNVRCSERPPRFIHVFPPGQGVAPAGFALIPAGSFEMGDNFGDWPENWGPSSEMPVHTVFVSAFYMGRTTVTKAQWDEVRAWAVNNRYTDLSGGFGKAANHPVVHVMWTDAVKWCNAASERAGLTPVYRLDDGAVYRTGVQLFPQINYGANGYRLPSEAEWEKAARGGLRGRRFPWGDTISHSQANYWSSSSYSYDVSPTRGYHPTYAVGSEPYTSPVGSFAPNGYGLYDMVGNVWELCNDWWHGDYYSNSPSVDPRGPSSPSPVDSHKRVVRGGNGNYNAFECRITFRGDGWFDWGYRGGGQGFRLARTLVP